MSVIPITLVLSLALVFLFLWLFLRERVRARGSSAERDSLMPLAEETPVVGSDTAAGVRVISFAGHLPGSARRHAHSGACENGKPEHERCPDCPSRTQGKH